MNQNNTPSFSRTPPDIIEERVNFDRDGLRLEGVLAYPSPDTTKQSAIRNPQSAIPLTCPAAREPERLVLLCAPHPNFAGDMENNVITALARALASSAAVLRFNYHGVGASQIQLPPGVSVFDYWQELEETHDYSAAVADTAAAARFLGAQAPDLQLDIVGYSFGSATGLRYGISELRARRLVGIAPPLSRVDFSFLAGSTRPCLLLAGRRDFVCAPADLEALAQRAGPHAQSILLDDEDHFFRGSEAKVVRHVAEFLKLATPLTS